MKFLPQNLCFRQVTYSIRSTARIYLVFGNVVPIHVPWSIMMISHVVIPTSALSALFSKGGE
jgi:hypothetical protein